MREPFKTAFERGLRGVWSHPNPFDIAKKLDQQAAGRSVNGLPFSIWQISVHALEWGWEMVNILKGAAIKGYQEDNYYPAEQSPSSEEAWVQHLDSWRKLEAETDDLLLNLLPEMRIEALDGITHADAMMILVGHNSYHTAQIIMMLRLLGEWRSG